MIIPFVKTMDDAVSDYKKKCKYNFLIPSFFKKKDTISKIEKYYVPFKKLDIKVKGNITYSYEDNKNHQIVKEINIDYNNLLFSKSKLIDNYFKYLYPYSNNYVDHNFSELSLVEDLDINIDKIKKRVIDRSKKNSLKSIEGNKVIETNNNLITEIIEKDVYLPIYYLEILYKNKNYYYIMNGESGKSYIELPFSKIRLFILFIIVVLIIFGLSLLIV